MKKYILLLIFFVLKPIIAQDLEITNWFNQESEQFLEIMNDSKKKDYNFEKYERFVERNFALKSISYGLLNEKIIEENNEETLLKYQDIFKKYLIKTIYNLANTTTSGEIILRDIDLKDKIFILNSEIKDGRSSISLYWKVFKANNQYKIIDVIVENTSYFVTKKSEFTKILRKNRGSLEKLIEELESF
jgi:ABC-type transporter MlaC component